MDALLQDIRSYLTYPAADDRSIVARQARQMRYRSSNGRRCGRPVSL